MPVKSIENEVFTKRGPISQQLLSQLSIRGGAQHISDALTRAGWNGMGVRVVPVVSTNPDTGAIIGSRFAVRGKIADYEIKASSLWSRAPKDVMVKMDLNGSDFVFSNRGDNIPANFSDWIDCRAANIVTLKKGDDQVPWEEIIPGVEDTSLVVRLEIHVVSVTDVMVYLTMIPLSLENLVTTIDRWEVDVASDKLPSVVLPWGTGTGNEQRRGGIKAHLMISERSSDGCGFGILPLIEQVNIGFCRQ